MDLVWKVWEERKQEADPCKVLFKIVRNKELLCVLTLSLEVEIMAGLVERNTGSLVSPQKCCIYMERESLQ